MRIRASRGVRLAGVRAIARLGASACGGAGRGSTASRTVIGLPSINLRPVSSPARSHLPRS